MLTVTFSYEQDINPYFFLQKRFQNSFHCCSQESYAIFKSARLSIPGYLQSARLSILLGKTQSARLSIPGNYQLKEQELPGKTANPRQLLAK